MCITQTTASSANLLNHGDEDLVSLTQLYHEAAQRFHGSRTEVCGLVQHAHHGMDDLRGIVTEVEGMVHLLNGLQGCPAGRGKQ